MLLRRRFDCARQPGHGCCSPHAATKRHTEEQEQGDSRSTSRRHTEDQQVDSRVTATVTRVLKSFSWL